VTDNMLTRIFTPGPAPVLTPVLTPALTLALALIPALGLAVPAAALADTAFRDLTPHEQRAEDLLRELIAFESTGEKPAENRRAMEAMAVHLRDAGFSDDDIQLVNPAPDTYGLIVRYRGRGEAKPILALAHMDVVTANPDAWAFPPFELGIRDGHYLGRGTSDNKAGVVQILHNFMRLKQEGWLPARDLVAAITGDEETEMKMAAWFASEESGLLDAAYALNSDGGGGEYDEDRQPRAFWVQTSEKIYQTWELTVTNEGGHSSQPRPDNAIEDLARAITRIAENPFPIQLDDGMRMMYARAADLYPEPMRSDMRWLATETDAEKVATSEAAARMVAANPAYNAELRTTCTPTLLRGGHAENALPRDATVTVNCRILPTMPVAEVEARLRELVSDLDVDMTALWPHWEGPPSLMTPDFLEPVEALVEEHFGDIPVIPSMSTGATDGLFYRGAGVPVYGVAAIFEAPGENRAHGLDERVGIEEFHASVAFWYDLFRTLAE
jgi:acetylornithine deacetylase/succinyl-diaminopimelate desuccinylase-like protein